VLHISGWFYDLLDHISRTKCFQETLLQMLRNRTQAMATHSIQCPLYLMVTDRRILATNLQGTCSRRPISIVKKSGHTNMDNHGQHNQAWAIHRRQLMTIFHGKIMQS
jgi:hypothetical protein